MRDKSTKQSLIQGVKKQKIFFFAFKKIIPENSEQQYRFIEYALKVSYHLFSILSTIKMVCDLKLPMGKTSSRC